MNFGKIARSLTVLLALGGAFTATARPSNNQVTVGMTQEFESMNPLIATMAASTYVYYMVGRPLTMIDADWKYQCSLCETLPSIENGLAKVVEEKGQKKIIVTWKLKKNLTWGDGTPLVAKDLVLAWEIGRSANVTVGSKDLYERIEKAEAPDDLTFVTTFKEARYDFYQMSTFYALPSKIEGPIWAKTKTQNGAYEKQTGYNADPLNPGLYNGPYVISELKLGSHIVTRVNKAWKGKKPAIKKFVLKLIPNTQTLEASLQSGTIDMISELGMTFDQAVAFEKRAANDPSTKGKFDVRFRDGLVYEHIDLNVRNPFLKDVRVRKALVHGIDRDKLTTALFSGKQKKALSNIHPLDPYYAGKELVTYDYSPEKATKLLEEAGFKKGADGYFQKAGEKLELVLMTTSGNKTRELVEQYIQAELKKIGIAITIKNEPARVFFGETVRKAKYTGMAMYAWISAPDSPPKTSLHSSEIPTKENGWSGQNSGGWSTKEVDQLLDDVLLEFDFEKRKAIMAKIQHAYTDQVPVIPLYLRAQIAVLPSTMKGFKLTGHQFYPTLSVEDWEISEAVSH
jgi:peptide/nickel transport system substrate-binding protein